VILEVTGSNPVIYPWFIKKFYALNEFL